MISDTTRIERVLIVLNPDGTLKGAHQESIRTVKDGETLLVSKQLDPVPVTLEALQAILPAAEWIAKTQAAVDAQAAAELSLQRMTEERDQVAAERNAVRAEVERLTALLNPPKVATRLSPYDFRALFTPEEIFGAMTCGIPVIVNAIIRLCTIQTFVDMEHPDTQALLGLMVQCGVITEERLAQVQAMQSVQA